jgi:copper(I)-binding protein
MRIARWIHIALLVTVGCSHREPPAKSERTSKRPAPSITITDARVRMSPVEGGGGAAYVTVRNSGDVPDRLTSIYTSSAEMSMLHEMVEDHGIARMVGHPDGFVIPAHGELVLKPGGKHAMLMGTAPAATHARSITLELRFEQAGTRTVEAPVAHEDAD